MAALFVLLVMVFLPACQLVPSSQDGTRANTVTSVAASISLTGCSSNETTGRTAGTSISEPSGPSTAGSPESRPESGASSDLPSDTQPSDTEGSELFPSDTGSLPADTPATTPQAASTPTTKPTTAKPTSTPTPEPTSPPAAAGNFPYKNYGVFFRDNYGQNSSLSQSSDGGITIDTGSAPNGVVLVKVDSSSIAAGTRCKVITIVGSTQYQYDIVPRGEYVGIPLQSGNGSYTITVYEQLSGTSYTSKMAQTFDVALSSSLKPFTASSVMVNFSKGSGCASKAGSLCSGIGTADGRVDAIYSWIVNNITYDHGLADSITSGQVTTYIPDPDTTYATRTGICFDYAALMCAMLRSQGIPTKLAVGKTSLGYHAWNEVYFAGQGWVVVASFEWQEISGSGWVMFDSTFAAGGMAPAKIQSTSRTKQKTY